MLRIVRFVRRSGFNHEVLERNKDDLCETPGEKLQRTLKHCRRIVCITLRELMLLLRELMLLQKIGQCRRHRRSRLLLGVELRPRVEQALPHGTPVTSALLRPVQARSVRRSERWPLRGSL